MKKIDIHQHFIPENYIPALRKAGDRYPDRVRVNAAGEEEITTEYGGWRKIDKDHAHFNIALRIRDMVESQRDLSVLSPSPNMFHYELENARLGEEIARLVNDGVAETVSRYPEYFMGMAMVPLQHPAAAIREVERAAKELNMRAVTIATHVNGRNLDEPEFFPFFKKVNELGLVVFLHPQNVAGLDRLPRYHLKNLIGNPTDTAIAIASLIYGGVLERLPELKLVFSHAGGSMPYLIGRHDHGYQVRPECKSAIPKPPSEYFKLLYFDTIAHSPEILAFLIKSVGSDHVVLGSDYPADMADFDPVTSVTNLRIAERDKQKILGRNAARLLNIKV